jgi:ribosomal protein L9
MEVILIQDVANLGYKNDIVKVKDGYGRNYLIPNRLAVIANDSNRKQLAENLKQQAHKMAKLLADAQALAEKLASTVITLSAKANEDGKIFGTITTAQVSEALAAQGIEVDKKIPRKGAIAAYEGQKCLIPLNMRDGSLICIGKGNEDWNYSAPHGAGRIMSRHKAREVVSLDEFREAMDGIFTTSVSADTVDEAPMVYKPIDEIIENIKEPVDILEIIKPVYNFKASEG